MTDIDIYPGLKLAAEAFLINNSGTSDQDTLTEKNYNDALDDIGAVAGEVEFSEWLDDSKNFERVNGNYILPYFNLHQSQIARFTSL